MAGKRRRFTVRFLAAVFSAFLLVSCVHAMQETTCKSKFKKKYDCPFSKITIVDDELDMGDTLKLRGCGKTVTYEGTREVLVE